MPVWPENKYAAIHARAMYMPDEVPNNSIPIKIQASGVFAAPEKTATNPIPANNPIGKGR